MRRPILRLTAALAALLTAGYVVVIAGLALSQDRFFFHPDTSRADLQRAGLPGFTAVTLTAADGARIVGWWRPPDPGRAVVVYLHGNADNLAVRAPRFRDLAATGAGVIAIDYRGYGGSTGRPTEAGLYQDARAAWAFVRRQAPSAPVVLWGESLGTGVAVQLATEVDEAGVVLDSPYAAFPSLIRLRAPWFPTWLVRPRLDSAGKVARIGSPLLIAHCEADRTIPIAEARRLYAAARQPKSFVALPGCGHTQIWWGPARAAILDFVERRGAYPNRVA
jgi:fermentation-respiration switch protein FrsA (DUF1100 family)